MIAYSRLLALAHVLALGLTLGQAAAEAQPALLPLPEPPAGMEPAVVSQLSEADRAVRVLVERQASLGASLGASSGASSGATAQELALGYGTLGELYLLYDINTHAEPCLRNASALAPAELRYVYLLGMLYQSDRRLEQAAVLFERALELAATDLPSLLRLGEVRLLRNELVAARAAFTRALELDPGSAAAHDGLGRVAYAQGENELAIERFEAVLVLQPEATSVHYRLALAYRQLGDLEGARRHLALRGDGSVQFPDPVLASTRRRVTGAGAFVFLGRLAQRQGAREPAKELFERALGIDANNPEAHEALGSVLEEQGKQAEAIGEYRQALRLGLDRPALRLRLARLEQESGDVEAARGHYTELLDELDPTLEPNQAALVHFYLGNLAASTSRDLEAEDHYREAISIAPDLAEARFNLATLLARRGRFAEAIPHLTRAIQLDPARLEAHLGLAMALLLDDRQVDARRSLERSLDRLPGEPALIHLLARLLAASPDEAVRDPVLALELARRLVELRPTPAYQETLAMALAAAGRFEEAIAWQERAIAALTGDLRTELEAARNRLDLYRRGEPCRDPWK